MCAVVVLWVACGCEGDDKTVVVRSASSESVDELRNGLVATILSVEISDNPGVVVEFAIEDDEGNPAALSQLDSTPSFVLGWIDVDPESGQTRYQSYIVRTVEGADYVFDGMTMAPTLETAEQAAADSGGSFETLEPGLHRYTFGTELPADFDRTATHSVGVYATREGRGFVANDVFTFVPAGGTPAVTRDVVTTASCNGCHGTLAIHGGARREVGLCVICHTDQTVDPETGENLDFGWMVHKIHQGVDLTNLPYVVVGFRQSVHDYSDVIHPQDVRNCSTCHREDEGDGGAGGDLTENPFVGVDAANWRTMPSRSDCGACHDDVNFETGENHSDGIQQFDDFFCSRCHRDTQIVEFDNTVPGAHVIPYKSSVNPDLTLTITDVQNMMPGSQPSVRFSMSDNSGPVDVTTLSRVAVVFGGPTTDYSQLISVSHQFTIQGGGAVGTLTANAVGDYTFSPDGYTIPTEAAGTWSIGMEARTQSVTAGPESIQFGANNPVVDVDLANGTLGGGAPLARRAVVEEAKCDTCHDDLRLHGNLRTDLAYCVLCHNLWATDERRRPGLDPASNPPESIDFKFMVHKIHRGTGLVNPYTVYGFGNTPHDYTTVRFPGDLNDCESCHVGGSHLLPGPPGRGATVVNIAGTPVPQTNSVRTPTAAACNSCHDDNDAVTHARINSIVVDSVEWSESCAVCHKEGASVAVSEAHSSH